MNAERKNSNGEGKIRNGRNKKEKERQFLEERLEMEERIQKGK